MKDGRKKFNLVLRCVGANAYRLFTVNDNEERNRRFKNIGPTLVWPPLLCGCNAAWTLRQIRPRIFREWRNCGGCYRSWQGFSHDAPSVPVALHFIAPFHVTLLSTSDANVSSLKDAVICVELTPSPYADSMLDYNLQTLNQETSAIATTRRERPVAETPSTGEPATREDRRNGCVRSPIAGLPETAFKTMIKTLKVTGRVPPCVEFRGCRTDAGLRRTAQRCPGVLHSGRRHYGERRHLPYSNGRYQRRILQSACFLVDSEGLAYQHLARHAPSLLFAVSLGGRGGVVARLLASQLGEPGSIPAEVAPGSSRAGIVPDDAGWQVFSGISSFLRSCNPELLHILTSIHPRWLSSPRRQGPVESLRSLTVSFYRWKRRVEMSSNVLSQSSDDSIFGRASLLSLGVGENCPGNVSSNSRTLAFIGYSTYEPILSAQEFSGACQTYLSSSITEISKTHSNLRFSLSLNNNADLTVAAEEERVVHSSCTLGIIVFILNRSLCLRHATVSQVQPSLLLAFQLPSVHQSTARAEQSIIRLVRGDHTSSAIHML
ncbi:hypothetical protein PR048_003042 [Dryococelus australis]|uniref:Uncharacterized protein n=1 Tax=Dryococelus australis TaxID=614101 RepID=A0ABQ9IM02_9NEOP|nr:hypothetical protein PR048_003042 [Dryococelus australis]